MTPKRGTLTQAEIREAAGKLGVEPAALAAVAEVESGPRGAFDELGRPTILFERHVFHRLTGGRFDDCTTTIVGRVYLISDPSPGDYGPYSHQCRKMEWAATLDRDAAWKSCSWGLFQIMGENHFLAGYSDILDFVTAMATDVSDHLDAFVSFIDHNRAAHDGLKDRNWPKFAAAYNGPSYAKNLYDQKIAAAYARLAASYKET